MHHTRKSTGPKAAFARRTVAAVALTAALGSIATAQAASSEETIRDSLRGARIQSIEPTPISGLFEVISDDRLFYVHESGNYIITGQIHDVRTRTNLTHERLEQLRPKSGDIAWDSIPMKAAIVHGSGDIKVAVFSDPNCPWCRRLHNEVLMNLENVTVYEIMYPVLGRDSQEDARAILCADDPAAALDAQFKGISRAPTPDAACYRRASDAVNEALAFGRKYAIDGTPAIITQDGRLHGGYMPMDEFKRFISR